MPKRILTDKEKAKIVAMMARKGCSQDVINVAMSNIKYTCDKVYALTGKPLATFLDKE
jgi:SOS response regulatory protein OraA/RecX